MSKITLNNVGSLIDTTTAQNTINNNNATIQTAFDNTLSRDGTSPNTMNASLDMNSNRISNLPDPVNNTEPVTLGVFNATTTGSGNVPAGGTTNQVLAKNSNTSYDTRWANSVTSVGLSLPADFTVTGSPVTTAGTLTGSWVNTPTGTGGVVRATSPTLVSPNIGAAVATSVNKVAITQPATAATLTLTDGTTLTGPALSGTVATLENNQTLTGIKSFADGKLAVQGATSGATVIKATAVAGSTTVTLPAANDTLVGKATTDTLTNKTLTNPAIIGTTTNDSAAAGNVGEYISSTVLVGSQVSLTTNTAANITSISLTAGDWDVWGTVSINPAGTTTMSFIEGWISTSSATLPTIPNNGAVFVSTLPFTTGQPQTYSVGKIRISLSGTTTVFLSTFVTFATSTNAAYGFIGARRVR